jgi:hypothetical protein
VERLAAENKTLKRAGMFLKQKLLETSSSVTRK